MKTSLKAFVVGSSFAVFVIPVFSYFAFGEIFGEGSTFDYLSTPTGLPLLLGVLNALFVSFKQSIPFRSEISKYFLTGFVTGFLMSLYGAYVENLPAEVFKVTGSALYYPHFLAPIVYGLVWSYIIRPLNHLVGIK